MSLATAGESWLSLSEPLWLIALGLCLLPVLWARWSRRRGRRAPRWATATECLALAMLAVALTGPKAPLGRGATLPWLVLVDASGSVRGQAREGWPALPAGLRTRRWVFAEGLSRRRPTSEAATNIGPALRLIASHSRSDTAGAVIATDGRFSDTDWHGAACAVAGAGIETLILPMDAPPPDARVAELTARRRGTHVVAAVTVVANAPVRRTLTVSRAGRADPVFERSLSLLAGAPATFEVSDTPAPDRIARYTARLTPDDRIPENDSAEAAVLPALPTIAAVGPKTLMTRWLKPLARGVKLLGAAESLPADPASLAGYAGIVVLDPTGEALGRQQRRALGRFVRSGGGLVLLGTGPSGRPGDRDDPLNRVLGLTPDPFRRRPLQLIVLLDHSGSMAAEAPPRPGAPVQRKFDLAAEAVVALKDHLTARDALTVITFADEPVVAYSVAGAVDVAALREALSRPPAGSTNVTPAMSKALSAPVPDGLRPMLLVLSDLQTEPFDPAPWAGKLRQAGAHLAVVAVGRPDPPRGVPP
ncbi:MAG: VWA domain-containing protein, partial [Planctomycetota bacterium]